MALTLEVQHVGPIMTPPITKALGSTAKEYVGIQHETPLVVGSTSNWFILDNGRKIFDTTGGAAVTCIGHADSRVKGAIMKQLDQVEYTRATQFRAEAAQELAKLLVQSTNGEMERTMFVSSGSEAVDAALKLTRTYFLTKSNPEPQRTRFIGRLSSYHGASLAGMALGHHIGRRSPFMPLLAHEGPNFSHVSPAHALRYQRENETQEEYVARLEFELEREFIRVGANTVCAFVAEPIVGAGLGCGTAPPGYFKAVRSVCDKFGALLIMDEVMCGLGRTGTYHAWQHPDIGVAPDIQMIGKTLGGGYMPIAGVLIGKKVASAMVENNGVFIHGQTYENHPVACAAALAVQRIIRDEGLVDNVRIRGDEMVDKLKRRLGNHPCVFDIRGRGLFIGVEFAQPMSKTPYPPALKIGARIKAAGMDLHPTWGIAGFPMQGCADGVDGDVTMIMPAYNITSEDVDLVVNAFGDAVERVLGVRGERIECN